ASTSVQTPFDASNFATVEDIMEAQNHIMNIIVETDKLKEHEERLADLQQKVVQISNSPHGQLAQHSPASTDASITQINEKLQQLEQTMALISHVLRSSHEDNAQLRREVRASLQQVQNHVIGELARCTENLTTVERNLDARLVAVNTGVGEVKKPTEAHQFAI